jgi:hypothetical protein
MIKHAIGKPINTWYIVFDFLITVVSAGAAYHLWQQYTVITIPLLKNIAFIAVVIQGLLTLVLAVKVGVLSALKEIQGYNSLTTDRISKKDDDDDGMGYRKER